MPTEVILTPGTLPEDFCPATEQIRYNTYISLTSASFAEGFSGVNFGPNQPTVENQDKPWIKTNSDGSLVGVYTFFSGVWVTPYMPGFPANGVIMYRGDAADVDTLGGGSAGAVTSVTGPFWQILTAFNNKIPVGADTVAVNTNSSTLADGSSATDQVRGIYFLVRTARLYLTA